jgi:hypothetical protein
VDSSFAHRTLPPPSTQRIASGVGPSWNCEALGAKSHKEGWASGAKSTEDYLILAPVLCQRQCDLRQVVIRSSQVSADLGRYLGLDGWIPTWSGIGMGVLIPSNSGATPGKELSLCETTTSHLPFRFSTTIVIIP